MSAPHGRPKGRSLNPEPAKLANRDRLFHVEEDGRRGP
jgi:hypothetical protein